MSFNFGGPVTTQIVPDETAAQRENRDIENRGGDQVYTEGAHVNVRDGAGATLSTVASASAGGRKDRDYLEREDDRNDYEYVNYANGTSALSGNKSDTFDAAKANDGLYDY